MTTVQQVKGFDIYHGDGVVQMGLAKQAGYQFLIAKASQGINGPDPMFTNNRARAHEVGLLFGAYHFFTSDDPIAQAQFFLGIAAPKPGELVLTLDVETYFDGVAAAALSAAQYIKQQTGQYPIIYSGESFYQSYLDTTFPGDDYTLWIARYGAAPDPSIVWAEVVVTVWFTVSAFFRVYRLVLLTAVGRTGAPPETMIAT